MAVAALQETVSLGMVRSPVAPTPPIVPKAPVAVAAPVAPVLEAAPVVVAAKTPAQPSAFAYLSDFAFWEGCDVDAALVPATERTMMDAVVSVAPVEPRKPAPTVESILAQFRIREWSKQPAEEPAVATVPQPAAETPAPVATPAPQEIPAQAAVEPVAEVAAEAAIEPSLETAGEATEDEVVLTVADAEEHVAEEVEIASPVAKAPAPAKAAPSVALYQPQPLPARRRQSFTALTSSRRAICFKCRPYWTETSSHRKCWSAARDFWKACWKISACAARLSMSAPALSLHFMNSNRLRA